MSAGFRSTVVIELALAIGLAIWICYSPAAQNFGPFGKASARSWYAKHVKENVCSRTSYVSSRLPLFPALDYLVTVVQDVSGGKPELLDRDLISYRGIIEITVFAILFSSIPIILGALFGRSIENYLYGLSLIGSTLTWLAILLAITIFATNQFETKRDCENVIFGQADVLDTLMGTDLYRKDLFTMSLQWMQKRKELPIPWIVKSVNVAGDWISPFLFYPIFLLKYCSSLVGYFVGYSFVSVLLVASLALTLLGLNLSSVSGFFAVVIMGVFTLKKENEVSNVGRNIFMLALYTVAMIFSTGVAVLLVHTNRSIHIAWLIVIQRILVLLALFAGALVYPKNAAVKTTTKEQSDRKKGSASVPAGKQKLS